MMARVVLGSGVKRLKYEVRDDLISGVNNEIIII